MVSNQEKIARLKKELADVGQKHAVRSAITSKKLQEKKEIADLKGLVAEQQTIIEELQQGGAEGRITAGTPPDLGLGGDPNDPNEVVAEEGPPGR